MIGLIGLHFPIYHFADSTDTLKANVQVVLLPN